MAEQDISCGLAALYVPAEADRVHSFIVTSGSAPSAEAFARLRAAALEGLAEALAPASQAGHPHPAPLPFACSTLQLAAA